MKRTAAATILCLALLTWASLGNALAYEVGLRAEPYTDVLSVQFGEGSLPPHSLRRTGPQQLTLTFHAPQQAPATLPSGFERASLIADVQATDGGLVLQLKTRAFGFVSAPVPGQPRLEIHVFSDVIGARWVDLSQNSLTMLAAKPGQAAARGTAAARKPALRLGQAQPAPVAQAAPVAQPRPEPEPKPAPAPELKPEPKPEPKPKPEPTPEPTPEPKAAAAEASPEPSAQARQTPPQPEQAPVPQFPASTQPLLPPGAPTLTLREALASALKQNPRLQASQLRAEGAEHGVSSARGALLPRVTAGASLTRLSNPNNTSESSSDYINQVSKGYSLQISQNLFDGLMRLSFLARTKLAHVRAQEERRKAELDLVNAVQQEYFKLIRLRSDIKTFTSSVARLMTQREAAHAFYRLEMAPRLTMLQVETALAQTEQRLSRAQSDEQVQLARLNALIGNAESAKVNFAGELFEFKADLLPEFEECLKTAMQKLPEIVISKNEVEIAQEELNISHGKLYPKVDASASYNQQSIDYKSHTTTDVDRKYYTMGLNFSWELFSGGETHYEIEARKKLLRSAQEEAAGLNLTVQSMVRESYLNVVESKKQVKIALLRANEAREAFDQASMRFRSGIGTSIDMLDAHERVTSAEAAINQAHADILISLAGLYRVTGDKEATLTLLAGAGAAH